MRLIIILLILTSSCIGKGIIQIRDFLCGCDYCETVDTGQPMHIGDHMIRCHSWRKGMAKTIELMNKTRKPELQDRNETQIELNKAEENLKIMNEIEPNKRKHEWVQDNEGEWTFSDENYLLNNNGWLYKESMGWIWSFNKKIFLYSENYGWLYNYSFNNQKIHYWYNRRKWISPKKLPQYE
jgi:hypothetical protein